jgi:REP element-mobilizing transposase RayT
MSRLRRLVLSDRFFFIICRLLPHRRRLEEPEFECLARVVRERREKHHFLLTAWVFLPDHWHAILFPRFPLSISRVMESIKEKPQSLWKTRLCAAAATGRVRNGVLRQAQQGQHTVLEAEHRATLCASRRRLHGVQR